MSLRPPKGLGPSGRKLWRSVTAEFDLDREPHRQRILFDACKLADMIDRLDTEADNSPLIVPGSYKQPVLHPAFSGAQTARSLMAQLLSRLSFEEARDDE